MALDQLAALLHRWQTASGMPGTVGPGGMLDRGRVVAQAGSLLRRLSVDERRELGRALAEGGVDHLAGQLDPHLPPPPAWEQTHPPAEQLLDLDARTAADLLSRLAAMSAEPPPPPSVESEPLPAPGPLPDPASGPLPEPQPLPEPEPLPQPTPVPDPVPIPDPVPGPVPAPGPDPFTETARVPQDGVDRRRTHRPDHAEARLRSVDETARTADAPSDLLDLLRRFPDGWQRRRAAQRLLERGLLGRMDPIDLLRLFAREGDRTRIAAAVLQFGEVDVSRLSGLLPAGTVHRLAGRAARSRR